MPLFEQERTARPLPGVAPGATGQRVRGHAARSEGDEQVAGQRQSGAVDRLGGHEHARGVALGVARAQADDEIPLDAGGGPHVGPRLGPGPRPVEVRVAGRQRVDRRVQHQVGPGAVAAQPPPRVGLAVVERLRRRGDAGRGEDTRDVPGEETFVAGGAGRVHQGDDQLPQPVRADVPPGFGDPVPPRRVEAGQRVGGRHWLTR
ncbi:hypothetical protein ACTMTI_34365 [Nonomuraea sp. H19]|uniref:hypothetical protein n=1 Tax=Nonomuraea sp. H19 TaxID=3452206 RepID=UPI003F8A3FE7